MDSINPDIQLKNRYSIFAECLIIDKNSAKQNTEPHTSNTIMHENSATNPDPQIIKFQNTKPSPWKHKPCQASGHLKEKA